MIAAPAIAAGRPRVAARPPRGADAEAGLTLVEMLVVLAIVGVMASAAVLGIGAATRAPSAESEARRLATTIQAAADTAMIDDGGAALDWDEGGYGLRGGARHRLPAGMTLAVRGAGRPAILGIDGTGLLLVATIAARDDRWTIAYDGLRATALRAEGAGT